MATEKTVISIEVEGTGKAINSIKELKAELKSAQSAALNGDGVAAKRVAELKDKMEDLKDETRSLQGSGIEKLKSSFGLLTDGFKNFDGDKISTAFKGIGGAMKAIPIFLIIEGIRYLVENFDELSKGSGILATILRSVGDVVSFLVNGFTDLIGVTSDSTRAIEEQGKAITKTAEESQAALNATSAAYDRQITVAKANGKSTVEIEKAKQKAIIDTNLAIAKSIEAYVRAGGELDDEKKKLLSGSLEAIKNAKVQEYVITETDNKAKEEQYKKHKEELKKRDDAIAAGIKKLNEERRALDKKYQAEEDAEEAARLALNEQMRQQKYANQIKEDQAAADEMVANQKRIEEAEKQRIENSFELTKQGLQSTKQDPTNMQSEEELGILRIL